MKREILKSNQICLNDIFLNNGQYYSGHIVKMCLHFAAFVCNIGMLFAARNRPREMAASISAISNTTIVTALFEIINNLFLPDAHVSGGSPAGWWGGYLNSIIGQCHRSRNLSNCEYACQRHGPYVCGGVARRRHQRRFAAI